MGKSNDVAIRGWIRSGGRFEGRCDGEALVLTWRKDTGFPFWKFRYRFAGKPRVIAGVLSGPRPAGFASPRSLRVFRACPSSVPNRT